MHNMCLDFENSGCVLKRGYAHGSISMIPGKLVFKYINLKIIEKKL